MSLEIGKAIGKILQGSKIGDYDVKTHYGDQFELNKWVGIQDSSDRTKYPLVYYILNKDYKERKGWIRSNITLMLLTTGIYEELNNERIELNYEAFLYPLKDLVKSKLTSNKKVVVIGGMKSIKVTDYPLSSEDLNKITPENNISTTTDVVDALILEFEAEINIECL